MNYFPKNKKKYGLKTKGLIPCGWHGVSALSLLEGGRMYLSL